MGNGRGSCTLKACWLLAGDRIMGEMTSWGERTCCLVTVWITAGGGDSYYQCCVSQRVVCFAEVSISVELMITS